MPLVIIETARRVAQQVAGRALVVVGPASKSSAAATAAAAAAAKQKLFKCQLDANLHFHRARPLRASSPRANKWPASACLSAILRQPTGSREFRRNGAPAESNLDTCCLMAARPPALRALLGQRSSGLRMFEFRRRDVAIVFQKTFRRRRNFRSRGLSGGKIKEEILLLDSSEGHLSPASSLFGSSRAGNCLADRARPRCRPRLGWKTIDRWLSERLEEVLSSQLSSCRRSRRRLPDAELAAKSRC